MARQEARAPGLGSQAMRDWIYFIFPTALSGGQKSKDFYLHFMNVKTNT